MFAGLGGLLFLFAGIRFFKPILFSTGICLGSLISYVVLLSINEKYEIIGVDYVFLFAPLVLGIILGVLFLWLFKLGIIAIGMLGGFSLSVWILSWKSHGLIPGPIFRPIFIAVASFLGSILGILFEKPLIIVGTSLIGAGLICSSVDIVFPSGFNRAIQLYLGGKETFIVSDTLMVCLSCFVAAVLIGILVQYKLYAAIGNSVKSKASY